MRTLDRIEPLLILLALEAALLEAPLTTTTPIAPGPAEPSHLAIAIVAAEAHTSTAPWCPRLTMHGISKPVPGPSRIACMLAASLHTVRQVTIVATAAFVATLVTSPLAMFVAISVEMFVGTSVATFVTTLAVIRAVTFIVTFVATSRRLLEASPLRTDLDSAILATSGAMRRITVAALYTIRRSTTGWPALQLTDSSLLQASVRP